MENLIDNKYYIDDIKKTSEKKINWDFLRNKIILMSGATGLLGRYFIDVIMYKNINENLNCKIIGITRKKDEIQKYFYKYINHPNFDYIIQDVTKMFNLPNRVDYIIHAASNTSPTQYAVDPIGTILTNVYGTKNLLDVAVNSEAEKFIFISSFEVYGKISEIKEIKENDFGVIDCTTLRSCYPESKRLSESLCEAYSQQKNINVSIVRLARVFGPTMSLKSSLATAQFIKNGINDEDIVLKSEGTQQYSYNYVADAVLAILMVMKKGKNKEAYNVSDMKYNRSLKEFAEIVAKKVNRKVIFDYPDDIEKKGHSNLVMTIMNSEKIKQLGWDVSEDIEEKIDTTLKILKSKD